MVISDPDSTSDIQFHEAAPNSFEFSSMQFLTSVIMRFATNYHTYNFKELEIDPNQTYNQCIQNSMYIIQNRNNDPGTLDRLIISTHNCVNSIIANASIMPSQLMNGMTEFVSWQASKSTLSGSH